MDAKTQAPLTAAELDEFEKPLLEEEDAQEAIDRYDPDYLGEMLNRMLTQARRALEAERALMLSGHKCRPIARAVHESDGRETWVGELLEPIPDRPAETHCLHITTPLKSVVFGFNNGDIEQMAVLMQVAHGGPINPNWLNLMADRMRRAALAAAGTPAG